MNAEETRVEEMGDGYVAIYLPEDTREWGKGKKGKRPIDKVIRDIQNIRGYMVVYSGVEQKAAQGSMVKRHGKGSGLA